MIKPVRSAWYIIRDGQRFGPYTTEDLKLYATEGRLAPTDLIWKEGIPEPVRARKIQGLVFQAAEESAPTIPAPAAPDAGSRDDNGLMNLASILRQPLRDEAPVEYVEPLDPASRPKTNSTRPTASEETAGPGAESLARGLSAWGEFFTHPLRHSFLLLVLVLVCSFAALPLITMVLVPAFVLGYIHCIHGMLNDESNSIVRFISFLRHGWDSLWHLLMMQASLVLLCAMAATPAVILGMVFAGSFGTAVLGLMQVGSLVKPAGDPVAGRPNSRQAEFRGEDFEFNPDRPKAILVNGLLVKIGGLVASLGEVLTVILGFLLGGLLFTLVYTPLASGMLLVFCLLYLVVLGEKATGEKFDLVYNALDTTIRIASKNWGRVLASGLWLAAQMGFFVVVVEVCSYLFLRTQLTYLATWMNLIVLPLGVFCILAHSGIFAVMTATSLTKE